MSDRRGPLGMFAARAVKAHSRTTSAASREVTRRRRIFRSAVVLIAAISASIWEALVRRMEKFL